MTLYVRRFAIDASTAKGGGFLVLLGILCFLTAVGIGPVPWITRLSRAAKRHTWGWLVVALCLGSLETVLYGFHLPSQKSRSAGEMYLPSASFLYTLSRCRGSNETACPEIRHSPDVLARPARETLSSAAFLWTGNAGRSVRKIPH